MGDAAPSATNKLSEVPKAVAASSGGYSPRRAQGRAAMRAPGAVVAPGFGDKKVSIAKAAAEAPFAQFAGQVYMCVCLWVWEYAMLHHRTCAVFLRLFVSLACPRALPCEALRRA